MTPEQWLLSEIKERGLKITWISDKTGLSEKCLSASLNGKRHFKVHEFLMICSILNLDPRDAELKGAAAHA